MSVGYLVLCGLLAQVSATMASGALLSLAWMSGLESVASSSSSHSPSPSCACSPVPWYLGASSLAPALCAPAPGTPETDQWRCLSITSSCLPLCLLLFCKVALTLVLLLLLLVLLLVSLAALLLPPSTSSLRCWECGRLESGRNFGAERTTTVSGSTVPELWASASLGSASRY